MKTYPTLIVLIIVCCSACKQSPPQLSATTSSSIPDDSANSDPFVVWAKAHAIRVDRGEGTDEFSDLQALRNMIGQARVVALGESGHGIHEFLAFRNRLLKFLVNELGFTAVAVETGVSEAIRVDDYVQGAADDEKIVAQNVFHWAAPKVFEENRQLIQWMKDHNAQSPSDRKIRFYGIDLTGGRDGEFTSSRQALDASLAYIQRVELQLGQQVRRRLEPFLAKFNTQAYPSLSSEERSRLTATIAELVNVFQRRRMDFLEQTSELAYARAYRQAVVAEQLDALFRNTPNANAKETDMRELMAVRDSAMADNVRWVLDREGARGRVLIFAHNWHVKKAAAQKEAYPEFYPGRPTVSMGQYLHSLLGDEMRVFGFTFQGAVEGFKVDGKLPLATLDPDSIDAAQAKVGLPFFIVDLRSAQQVGSIAEWLNRGRKIRFNERYGELNPMAAFDALVYADSVSGVQEVQTVSNDHK